jgi:guanylate kinase
MKILIVGKGASGKDSLGRALELRGLKKCVFNTTRPKRNGETDGVDYFFSDPTGERIVEESYNDWNYSLTKENWDSGDFAIFTPSYLRQLPTNVRDGCFVIYVDVPESTRIARLGTRNDADSVERRIITDRADFDNFHDYDWRVLDSNLKGLESHNPLSEVLFERAVELIASGQSVEEVAGTLDKEWGGQVRAPLPNETLESYVTSRLHLELGSIITITEDGKHLFLYFDALTKRLNTVGNLQLTTAADSLFSELSKTVFRKVRETQLGMAESILVIQSVKDAFSFGSLPKRVRDNINGFLEKYKLP